MGQTVTDIDIDQSFAAATYTRLAAAVRLVACFAALHVAFSFNLARQHPNSAPLTALILLFSIYATWLYWRAVRDKTTTERQIFYWIDTLWYLAITVLTDGPGRDFFLFLSFPMLFVSIRWGFTSGITMAAFSSLVLLTTGILRHGAGVALLNADILLPPIGLLVLGYLMATWAQADLTLNRRLYALKEFNAIFNPRFNIEQTIDRVVRHLAKMHRIDKFALIVLEAGRPPKVFRANLPDAMYQVSDSAAVEIGNVILGLNAVAAVIYSGGRGLLPAELYSSDANAVLQKNQVTDAGAIADRFDCASFASVQFPLRPHGSARLIVWSDNHRFGSADLAFFHQLGAQVAPGIENVQLLDRLASEVADAERQKISRDIHDSAIQPYIGLKFGLEALARKVPSGDPLSKDIEGLVEIVSTEIAELRGYVRGLRGDEDPGRAALVPALQRQAARFGDLYGITVIVQSPAELRIGDELANEAFHIVSEALSNIRRHTTATHAHIDLSYDVASITLKISNPCGNVSSAKLFTPRSIAERARALGGSCQVETVPHGDTIVTVTIPLRAPIALA